MAKKKYHVTLSPEEREALEHLLRRGKASARKLTRARILLKAAAQQTDDTIRQALGVSIATVERTRQRFVECGLDALNERPRPGKAPKLDAKAEARLIAEACSPAPEGRERWTLQLLADRVVTLQLAEAYSDESVRRRLKKTNSSRGSNNNGVSPRSAPSL
jgi:transposase